MVFLKILNNNIKDTLSLLHSSNIKIKCFVEGALHLTDVKLKPGLENNTTNYPTFQMHVDH